MSSAFFVGPPGITAKVTANFKALFTHRSESFLSQGRYIDGTKSRDPSNTVDVGVLQPGLIMGKITSSGLYAPSIFGLTNGAYNGSTSVTLASAAIGTEIVRRIGATGSVKMTGPPTAAGTVRTLTLAYSAISGTTMTVTAANVNEVQTINFTNSPSGTFVLQIVDSSGVIQTTQPITYSATIGTLLSNLQTATDAVLAANAIVWSGSVVTAVAGTFSGTGYAALPQTNIVLIGDGMTAGDWDITKTTTGVDGRFVTKSLIQPTDGSETPLSFLPDWDAGIAVTDSTGTSVASVDFPKLPTMGEVDVAQMINWPVDTSLVTWLQSQLSTSGGGKFVFNGTGGVY